MTEDITMSEKPEKGRKKTFGKLGETSRRGKPGNKPQVFPNVVGIWFNVELLSSHL